VPTRRRRGSERAQAFTPAQPAIEVTSEEGHENETQASMRDSHGTVNLAIGAMRW